MNDSAARIARDKQRRAQLGKTLAEDLLDRFRSNHAEIDQLFEAGDYLAVAEKCRAQRSIATLLAGAKQQADLKIGGKTE